MGDAGSSNEEPQWMREYPQSDRYFIGIGSSNTGVRSEDLDKARAEALSNLAASISVEIRSETTFEEQETTEGGYAASVTSNISQTVDKNLQDVETVDSFYTEEQGYWIYLRLDKQRWARIQQQEMDRVISRAKSHLTPAGTGTLADEIAGIGKALELVRESAYRGLLETSLNGRQGMLSDLLETRAASLCAGLQLSIEPERMVIMPGEGARVNIRVNTQGGTAPGSWKVILSPKTRGGAEETVTTTENGGFSGQLELASFPLGESAGEARLDISRFGYTEGDLEQFRLPVTSFVVERRPIQAALEIRAKGAEQVGGLAESVRAAVDELDLPLSLSGEATGEYSLEVVVTFRDLPKLSENAICFTKARATVSLLKSGSSVYSRELAEVKDGGIDFRQAHERAFKKLMKAMREDRELERGMAEALGL
jgi:hypothetical protein